MLQSTKRKLVLPSIILSLLCVGSIATFILVKSNQDIRQQASGECSVGDPYCSCDINERCVKVNPDGPRKTVEQGGEENDKGILATSFTGDRPKTEGGCGGVWQNDFCYMPGDELSGGYIVVESGRYNYPHFEKKETYESLGYGAETVTGKMGSEKDLGSDCGGQGLAVDGTCYTYGSTINGYLVMPSRESDCDNADRDYCYAHLKKIETEYDDWQSAVDAFESTGDSSQLEKLYKDNYGVSFEVGGLFDPNADNADMLKAQALIAALTNADVLQVKASEQNAALDEKIKKGETLTEAEQAMYNFNRDIVADENFDKRYFYLDELSASTVQQTTMNQAVQEMYTDLVVIGSDGELDKAASEKFKEIFGYDPAEKYGETKGVLEALGIDYSRFDQDRTIYANELKKQQQAQEQAEAAQQQAEAAQERSSQESELLSSYQENHNDLNALGGLYKLYTGEQSTSGMTSSELINGIAGHNAQIALQAYLDTGDIQFLQASYAVGKSSVELRNYIPTDEKTLLQDIFGMEIGLDIYNNAVLPTMVGNAVSSFAENPDQLESVCTKALGSECNIDSGNASEKLGEVFDVVYEGTDVNVAEMTVAYSNQLLADAKQEKKESWWELALNSIAMGMSSESMAMASLTSDTMKEAYAEQIDYQSEVMANYSLAVETSQIFDAQDTFEYANQAAVREYLSDFTWGTSLGNAVMYDNVFDREYDLQDDLGLNGLDAASLTWNQVKTQGFNVTSTVENIATNYAISTQTGYTGPANTNVADLALQSAQNLGVLDYDYQEAQTGHYFKQGVSNVGATITDWAVTAGTYTSLAMQAANENATPYAYAATTVVSPDIDYAEIADEAKEAGDAAAAAVRQNAAERLAEQHNQQVETEADKIDSDQYVTFQLDEEIVRSRQELNWETVKKVVAPAAAVVVLPIAVASGAGIGVIAGVSSSAFSLYQGAGQKAQALELERVVISEDMDNRKNVAALSMVKYSPDPITYEEAMVDVEEQVDMLNKQGNMMVASSAVAALTSGAGIVNGFAQGGQAAMATGQSVSAVQQLAMNSGQVAQAMSTAGRVGGIGLSGYNAINSGQQAVTAANTLSGLDEAVLNGDLTEAEADAMRGNLKGQVAMSGLSSFVAASGVVGNTFGFIRNPSLQTQAITTKIDLILDIMNVPAGVAVDAQNVSQSCFNQSYPSGDGDCRDAWIGLALSLTQDVAQVRNSTSSFKSYQYDQQSIQGKVGDFSQRISLLDVEMRTLLDNPQRTFGDTLKLGELQIARQELADAALKLSPGLVIPDLVRPVADVNVDTQKILDTAEQNRVTLNTRASEVEGADPALAAKLRQDADDNWDHQAGILKINEDIANIDAEISQRSAELSALDIEGLRGRRDGLVNELEGRVNDQNFKAANLDLDNKQLLAAAKVNAAFETYDSDQRANNQAGVGIERNLSPPDTADIKKRTGLASLLPGSAEQNKALDLASLQTKILEAEDLNARRTQVEQDLEKFIGIDPNDHMVEILRTELADITQKITQANQVVDQVTKSIGGPPSIWQRLTAGLPSQKTAQDYDQAMLAMRDMSSLRQEMDAAVRDIEKLSTQNRLSEGDQKQLDTLSRRLREASIEYDAAEGVVKGVYDRAQTALDPQVSKNKVAAFFTKTFGGLGGILPSRSKKAVVAQQDFDSSYESAEAEAQRVQVRQEVKSQLADAKDSYDELTRNQNEIKKSDSEIARLEQELVDLERTVEPLTDAQTTRVAEIPGEIEAIRDVKKIFSNSIGRLEDKLLKPILSADVSERLIEAQQKGNFDEVLGTIRTEELDRLAENRLGLSSRQDFIIEDLLKIKSGITNSSSAEDLVTQRDLYNQKLSELSESILSDSPEAANYQRLSDAQQFLKNMDVLTAARAARAEGDHDGAVDILSSREASIPVEDPVLAARLGTIIRDAEFRTGASEGIEFFNARTNQMDTFLKILEGERVAIELTTAGGKTFVGSVLLRAQTELLGYNTGIYIAKPGQEADIQTSMMKAYGVGDEEVVILDSTRLSEADYLSTLLASRFVVADPSNLQFIRNIANNFKDPNFKVANDVYRKLTQNTSLYIDELQINLDPSRQAINSVGASSEDIPDAYKDSARLVGEALEDTLLRNGGWGLGDNDFLVLRTEEGAEIAKFGEAAQDQIFGALAQKMGISTADYGEIAKNAPELERAFNQDTEVLKQKLATLGVNISPPDVERIFDQIDMMNTFAQGLKMKAGTDYQRMIDEVLANNGGPNRPVTVPASGAVANEGQSYTAKLQAAMEYIGARANNEDPNFDGLTSSPNLAFKSTIADYLGDLRNSSVGAVTGALADGRGVAETALGLVTYRSTEAVEKILSIEGSSTGERINVERSYQVSRSGDVDALVALKLAGKLNQSAGEDANGNLKVVMGFDGAKNPLDFATEMAKSGAFADSEFAVQNADGSYSLIKLSPSGEVLSTRDVDTKAIQDLYNDKQNPAQNLVTIIGRGGATGDSIKTAKNVPGVTVTSFDAPEGLVAQAGARIDRGSDIADQYALIINRDAQPLNIDKPADFLKVAQMTESDFTAFRNRVTEVQKIVEQSKNTQALDQGVIAASTRVLSDLIRNSTDPEIQKWASSKLLEFYSETTTRDLDLKGGAQESLLARQKKISAQVDGWERLLADRANSNILDTIKKSHPDLYAQMRSNVNANDQKLAYAQGEVDGKESVMTAANLADFVDKHNKFVVADSENKYVADSGRPPMVDQIATDTQRNSITTGKAKARIAQVIESVKGLKNISINISNPLAGVPGLVGQIRGTQFAQNVSRLPGNIQSWSADVREVQRNQRILYAGQVTQLESLNDQLAAEDDIADRAKIIEKIAQIREEMGEVGRVAKASVTLANLFKGTDSERGGAFRISLRRDKANEEAADADVDAEPEAKDESSEPEQDERTLAGDIGFALGRAWRRRGTKTSESSADEKTLAEDVGFALAKAWERRKNPTAKAETGETAEAESGERTRVENFGFALAKAWATRVIPGASVMGEKIAALLNIAPKEIRDKRAQIIADFRITDPGLKAEISTYRTVEKLDAFIHAKNIAYKLLRDQFASLNTKPDSGIQNEENYKAQAKKLREIVAEIEGLQAQSKLSFALTQDGHLQQDALGKYTRVNKDQFKTLSEFRTRANKEIARLEKDRLDAEAQAEEQRLADEAKLEKERLAQVEADRLVALELGEAQQQAAEQLAAVRNNAIGGLGAAEGSEIWEKINTAKDESEIDVIVTERRLKYQYVKDQLRALGTTVAAINNEADYQAQQNRMLEIVEEIETLERKSRLEFLTINDDPDGIPVVRIDQNKNLSAFRAEAQGEIARLATENTQRQQLSRWQAIGGFVAGLSDLVPQDMALSALQKNLEHINRLIERNQGFTALESAREGKLEESLASLQSLAEDFANSIIEKLTASNNEGDQGQGEAEKFSMGEPLPTPLQQVLDSDFVKSKPLDFQEQARIAAYMFLAKEEGKSLVDTNGQLLDEEMNMMMSQLRGSGYIAQVDLYSGHEFLNDGRKIALPNWLLSVPYISTAEVEGIEEEVANFYEDYAGKNRVSVQEGTFGTYSIYENGILQGLETEVSSKIYIEPEQMKTVEERQKILAFLDDLRRENLHPRSSKLFEGSRVVFYWNSEIDENANQQMFSLAKKHGVSLRGPAQDPLSFRITDNQTNIENSYATLGISNDSALGDGGRNKIVWREETYDLGKFFENYLMMIGEFGKRPDHPYMQSYIELRLGDLEDLNDELIAKISSFSKSNSLPIQVTGSSSEIVKQVQTIVDQVSPADGLAASKIVSEQLQLEKSHAILSLDISEDSDLYKAVDSVKTTEELREIVSQRKSSYEKLNGQFSILGIAVDTIDNETKYSQEFYHLESAVEKIVELQKRSSLRFLEVDENGEVVKEDGLHLLNLVGDFTIFADFAIAADEEIKRLAEAEKAAVEETLIFERESTRPERVRKLEKDFANALQTLDSIGRVVPQSLSLSELRAHLKKMQQLSVLIITNEDHLTFIGQDTTQLLQNLGSIAESFYEAVRQKEEAEERKKISEIKKNILRVVLGKRSNQESLGGLKKKIGRSQSVKGQFTDLLWTHNTSFSSLSAIFGAKGFSSLTNRGRQYIQERGITEDEFWQSMTSEDLDLYRKLGYVKRGFNARYGLSSDYGDIKFVFKPGFEQNYDRGINSNKLTSGAYVSDFFSLDHLQYDGNYSHDGNRYEPRGEFNVTGLLKRKAQEYDFNAHLDQNIEGGTKPSQGVLQRPYLNPQLQVAGTVSLDDVQAVLVPEHLYDETVRQARHFGFDISKIVKVETGNEENYYAYDSRKDRPSKETDTKKKKAVADGVMRPYRVGYVSGSSVNMVTAKKAFEKEQQAYLNLMLDVETEKVTQERAHYDDEFLFNLLTEEIGESSVVVDLSKYSLSEMFKVKLSTLFRSSARVWEKYSVKEHTRMVYRQFRKYLAPNLTQQQTNFYTMLIALHDIGKPIERKHNLPAHSATVKIARKALKSLGYEDSAITRFAATINQDFIGDYIKGNRSYEETLAGIKKRAEFYGQDYLQYFEDIYVLYFSDAAAYTVDAGGFKSLDERVFDVEKLRSGQGLAFNVDNTQKINRLKSAIESISGKSTNGAFKNLCSSCSLVRNQTEEGLQQADAMMAENISKQGLARANRLLAENPDLEGGEDKAEQLEIEAKNLEQEAEKLKQQALAQIDKIRKEVVNAHGMQNRFIQLYLNAQVDADEAEIRKTRPDVNKAIDSAYQATVEAEDLLAAGEMVVVTQKGFLGIGRKTQTIRLTADDIADVKALKDGGGDTPGLIKIVEFERNADGSLNRKKTVSGTLHDLQQRITRGYIFDIGPRLRVLGRSVDTSLRQSLSQEVSHAESLAELEKYVKPVLEIDEELDLIPLSEEIEVNSTDHILDIMGWTKEEALEQIKGILNSEHQDTRFLSGEDEMVVETQDFADKLVTLINEERFASGKKKIPPAKVYISSAQTVNAFALPDGSIVIHQGLINALETKDQLFAILAHEVSHYEDKFLNWHNMLLDLTSDRAQEYKADVASTRLAKLGYHAKAIQSAAEILNSISNTKNNNQSSFWKKRGVSVFGESPIQVIADIAHGSLFNRNINLEVIFKYYEFGIQGNVRSTPLPSSWKKVTNRGFLGELVSLPQNRYWERLFAAAPESIRDEYYQKFIPNFNTEMRNRIGHVKDKFDETKLSFWQRTYNTIFFQGFLGRLNQELDKFDYLVDVLVRNQDGITHREAALLLISADKKNISNPIDDFKGTLAIHDYLGDRRLFFRWSPLFFKIRQREKDLLPKEDDLNVDFLTVLADEQIWQETTGQQNINIEARADEVLYYLLSERKYDFQYYRFNSLDEHASALDEEFSFVEQIRADLDQETRDYYELEFKYYLLNLAKKFEDQLISQIKKSEGNFSAEQHWDQLVALNLRIDGSSNQQVFDSMMDNYSFKNNLTTDQQASYRAYLRDKLGLGGDESSAHLIDLSVFNKVSQLSESEQQKKTEQLRELLISRLMATEHKQDLPRLLLKSIEDGLLEPEDRVWLKDQALKLGLEKENIVTVYPGDESLERERYELAQEFIFQFSGPQNILGLANQVQEQYMDYLKSLVVNQNWTRLSDYLKLFADKRRSGTGYVERTFKFFEDFTIITEMQTYLSNLPLTNINQNISGFGMGASYDGLSAVTVSQQMRMFLKRSIDESLSLSKNHFFGTNKLEADLLRPLVEFELDYFEENSSGLEGVELYEFFEDYYPNLDDKKKILDRMAARLLEDLEFADAYDFLQYALKKGHNHYIHYFLENHVRTLEEYEIVTQGENAGDILGFQNSGLTKTTVFDTLISNLVTNLNEDEALGFFEASIKGDHEQVKYYLAKYYSSLLSFEGESELDRALKSFSSSVVNKQAGVLINEDGEIVGPGASSFPTFDEFVFSFYSLSKLEKTVFLSKMLAENLLLKEENYSKIAVLLTDELEDSEEVNLKPLLKNIVESTLSQRVGSTKIQLGIARSLADSFLQGDPREVSNDYAINSIMKGFRDSVEKKKDLDFTKAEARISNLLNQDRSSLNDRNSSDYQFVFEAQQRALDIATSTLGRLGINIDGEFEPQDQAKIPVGKFITELAKSLGSLGVRFLQVFGQYFDLPPELQNEFLSVYDDASDLYMANLFQSSLTAVDTLSSSNGDTPAEERRFNSDQSEKIEKMLPGLRIIKKIGGGSINTTYLVEIEDPQTSEKSLKVLKISNPNVLLDVADVGNLVKSIVSDLEKMDKKNKDDYAIVQRLMQTLEQWNAEDIQDKEFLTYDPLFSRFYPYQSTHGFEFEASQITNIYNRWIKVEDYVDGDTLKNIVGDLEREIAQQGGNPTAEQLARAQRIEELTADITADYVRHLNEPVILEDGRQVYILHSDLHIGNVMADQDLTKVSVIDRSYYLVLSQEEVDLVKSLLSSDQPDTTKFTNLTKHLLETNDTREKGRWNYWTKYLSYARVALKNKFTRYQSEEDKQVAFFNAMMQETDRLGLDFPLNVRLFVKNMSAINKMLSKIGDDKLSDYLSGDYKTEYDGSSLIEEINTGVSNDGISLYFPQIKPLDLPITRYSFLYA